MATALPVREGVTNAVPPIYFYSPTETGHYRPISSNADAVFAPFHGGYVAKIAGWHYRALYLKRNNRAGPGLTGFQVVPTDQ